jgi:hypothetical protein
MRIAFLTRAEEWVGQEERMLSGVENTVSNPLAALVSLLTLVIGASGLFRALCDALNRVRLTTLCALFYKRVPGV